MAMSWVGHFSVVTPWDNGNFHKKEYLKLHYLAGSTIQFPNLVNYKDGNNYYVENNRYMHRFR